MDNLKLTIASEANPADVDRLRARLTEHALSKNRKRDYKVLMVLLRDEAGSIVGGLYGNTLWGWLEISLLWVDQHQRVARLGSRIMAAAEQEAIARGCRYAKEETFSFQALEFYRKKGHEVFAELDDFPEGESFYFLKKRLR
jgi:GNAT superfamily N-acetyltransferase